MGNRNIVLAKELTKVHEKFIRDTIQNIIIDLEKEEKIKGEYVLIVEGSDVSKNDISKENLLNLSLNEHYNYYEKQGLEKKEIIKRIAKDRNVNKNEIYQNFI